MVVVFFLWPLRVTAGTSLLLPVDDQVVLPRLPGPWFSLQFCTDVCFLEACDYFTGFKRRACGPRSWKRQVQRVQCVGREEMDTDLDSWSGSDHIRHWATSCHSEANSLPVDGSGCGLFFEMCLGPLCSIVFLYCIHGWLLWAPLHLIGISNSQASEIQLLFYFPK